MSANFYSFSCYLIYIIGIKKKIKYHKHHLQNLIKLVSYPDHCIDIALWACEFCGILHFDQHNEVKVMPHVVFCLCMFFKANCFVVKCRSIKPCVKQFFINPIHEQYISVLPRQDLFLLLYNTIVVTGFATEAPIFLTPLRHCNLSKEKYCGIGKKYYNNCKHVNILSSTAHHCL